MIYKKELVKKVAEKVKKSDVEKESFLTDKIKTEVNRFALGLKEINASELNSLINNFFVKLSLTSEQKNEVMTSLIKAYQLHLVSPEHKKALKNFVKENKLNPDVIF